MTATYVHTTFYDETNNSSAGADTVIGCLNRGNSAVRIAVGQNNTWEEVFMQTFG